MSSTPRDVLIEIVAKYGEPLLASPLRAEGLLKDYCGEFRREIFVLVSCLRVGVVDQLRHQGGPSVKLVCARLALKLEQNLAISSDVAKWAVESWAIALGLLEPENATARLADIAAGSAQPSAQNQPETGSAGHDAADYLIPQEDEVEFLAEEFQSGWPVPDWANPAVSILVYPDASGQRPTLREALQAAVPNSCLLLQPGVYRESLVIRKDLQIRSEGDADPAFASECVGQNGKARFPDMFEQESFTAFGGFGRQVGNVRDLQITGNGGFYADQLARFFQLRYEFTQVLVCAFHLGHINLVPARTPRKSKMDIALFTWKNATFTLSRQSGRTSLCSAKIRTPISNRKRR